MTSASIVRLATPEDEGALMELCRLLHAENGKFNMDDARVLWYLQRATRHHSGIIGVIGPNGAPEAAICMLIEKFWYGHDLHLEELFMFVHPEHRRSEHAKTLISYAKRCSDSLDIPLVIGVMSDKQTEAKCRLYARQLGPARGAFFFHNLKYTPVELAGTN